MKTTVLLLSTVAALLAAGCAGTLTPEEQQQLFDAHSGTGGVGSGPTTSTTSTSTGSGGSVGPAVDMCVVNTTALKSCQQVGCHSGTPLSAGLDLSMTSVTTNAKSFKDKMNVGTDPMGGGCMPNTFKLVDSANPMNSLIYTKVEAPGDMPTHPCGGKMPVIGTFTSADKACILSWVMSVASLP